MKETSKIKEFGLKMIQFLLGMGMVFSILATVFFLTAGVLQEQLPELLATFGLTVDQIPGLAVASGSGIAFSGIAIKVNSTIKSISKAADIKENQRRAADREFYMGQLDVYKDAKDKELDILNQHLQEQNKLKDQEIELLKQAVEVEKSKMVTITNKDYK